MFNGFIKSNDYLSHTFFGVSCSLNVNGGVIKAFSHVVTVSQSVFSTSIYSVLYLSSTYVGGFASIARNVI